MHVALDIRTLHPRFPGIGRYVANLVRHLPSHLAATDSLTLLLETGAERPTARSCGEVTTHYCETSSGVFSITQRWDIPNRLRAHRVELFHSPILTVSIPLPIPQILTLNDLIPIRLPQHVSWRARRFFPGLLRKQVRRVKRVIVPSEFTKQELVNWSKLSGERVIVIPHAVAETFHRPSQEEVSRVRQKFGLSDYLLALFSNRRHKNLMRLEQAYRSSNLTVPLVIAGAGRGTREEAEHGSPEPAQPPPSDRDRGWSVPSRQAIAGASDGSIPAIGSRPGIGTGACLGHHSRPTASPSDPGSNRSIGRGAQTLLASVRPASADPGPIDSLPRANFPALSLPAQAKRPLGKADWMDGRL